MFQETLNFFLFLTLVNSSVITISHKGKDIDECLNQKNNCASLNYALEGVHRFKHNNVTIRLTESNYSLRANSSVTTFKCMKKFELIGNEQNVSIRCASDSMIGLQFFNSSNIHFENISLLECGVQVNYRNISTITIGVYLFNCTNICFNHVNINDSPQFGLMMFSPQGECVIKNSNFVGNAAISEFKKYNGSGVTIEFETDTDATVSFISCSFRNNGGGCNSSAFQKPHSSKRSMPENPPLSGGLGIRFLKKAKFNLVKIEKCHFDSNTATWGGGLLADFLQNAVNNSLIVEDCVFFNNTCLCNNTCQVDGTGGGGVRISFKCHSFEICNITNNVNFSNTTFERNSAYYGGGISLMTSQTYSKLSFFNITFTRNEARQGSAAHSMAPPLATLSLGISIPLLFSNCIFEKNSIDYSNYSGIPVGFGTLYSASVPVVFDGTAVFENNTGSAIGSINAPIEFYESTKGIFDRNVASHGAGIALFGKSVLVVHEDCELNFTNNIAIISGGGIYWKSIGDYELLVNGNCFIQYVGQNQKNVSAWNAKFHFHNNSAGVTGNDIYATTLIGCLQNIENIILSDSEIFDELKKVFNWSASVWIYEDEDLHNKSKSIATDPGFFVSEGETHVCTHELMNITVIPGKSYPLPLQMVDDRLQAVPNDSLIFSAIVNDTNDRLQILSSEWKFNGSEQKHLDYDIRTLFDRSIRTKMTINFSECPPGYVNESDKCVQAQYPHMRFDQSFSSSIQVGYWIGKNLIDAKNRQQFYLSWCKYCSVTSQSTKSNNYVKLPEKSENCSYYPDQLNDFFCNPSNRKGPLCSHCKDHYAPSANSANFDCVTCSEEISRYSWLLYLLLNYIPITLILSAVLLFDISVTSGPANSFVVFAQMIPRIFEMGADGTVEYPPSAKVFVNAYTFIYGFWNLDFYIPGWNYCLGPNVTSNHLVCLDYIKAAFPLLVLIVITVLLIQYHKGNHVVVCMVKPVHLLFARAGRLLNFQRSIMDAFATFLILSYTKFVVTSSMFIYPSPYYSHNGTIAGYVSYLNASYVLTSLEYAPFFIFSCFVFVFICVLMPTFLFLYSMRSFYSFLAKLHLKCFLPGEKGQYFLDAFHHCYKDGRDGGYDRRYFASLVFFFRLALVLSYIWSTGLAMQYLIQQVICTVAALMVGICQPYRNRVYNMIDIIIYGIMAIINSLTFYNWYLQSQDDPQCSVCLYIQIILVFVPTIYIVVFIIHYLCRNCSYQSVCLRLNHFKQHSGESVNDFSFSKFMNDVTAESRLSPSARDNTLPLTIPTDTHGILFAKPEEKYGSCCEKTL